MVSLAELKMHIRDEHAQSSDAKARLKHHFGVKAPEDAPHAQAQLPSI